MFITDEPTPCKEIDPELWFARPGTLVTQIAKSHCYTCIVRLECLHSAVAYEKGLGHTQAGVYGGLDEKERHVFLDIKHVPGT